MLTCSRILANATKRASQAISSLRELILNQEYTSLDYVKEHIQQLEGDFKIIILEDPQERQISPSTLDGKFFGKCIESIQEKLTGKPPNTGWKDVIKCALAFCELGNKVTDMIQNSLPPTPEYQMPFRALVILFTVSGPTQREDSTYLTWMQTVNIWRNKGEELSGFLNDLVHDLNLAGITTQIFEAADIKALVIEMYIQVVEFIKKALEYAFSGLYGAYPVSKLDVQAKGWESTVQMWDAIRTAFGSSSVQYQFSAYKQNIEHCKAKLTQHIQVAHMKQQNTVAKGTDARELKAWYATDVSVEVADLNDKIQLLQQREDSRCSILFVALNSR
jgi:hypothetical protein